MSSTFTWLAHSDGERRRLLDAIDRFKEKDTRDELGLGGIRDVFAGLFFPGTSTIQTRARYFLFIPWIYRGLERRKSSNVVDAARRHQLSLCDALCAAGESEGVIGGMKKEKLKRLPSSIYWQGLEAWNIREFSGSEDEYHRRIREGELGVETPRDDDSNPLGTGRKPAWHAHLPDAPEGFPAGATLRLSPAEAEYLAERIQLRHGGSLLNFLCRRGRSLDGDYPWEHPQFGEFPSEVRSALEHARFFAETMHGAALLYNLMLSEEIPNEGEKKSERVASYRTQLAQWSEELRSSTPLKDWNRGDFWQLVKRSSNVTHPTERFVEEWQRLEPWGDPERAASSAEARQLLRVRERQLKKGRARLGNRRALELWGGAAGAGRLNYRWPVARRLLHDIFDGLGREVDNA